MNTQQLVPYLMFDGNCREAMNFYRDCLGGDVGLKTIGESPMKDNMPAEKHEQIMHASLVKNGQVVLFASDLMGAEALAHGNDITLCLNCTSEEEIQTTFRNLAAGGKITHELKKEFWGDTFGMLTDKFGLNWMFNYGPNQFVS
jgi:PhnB protein